MSQSPTDNSTDLICPECGYDLRGIESDRCPECGTAFDRATAFISRIPWSNRATIGFVRGYLRTVWRVIRRPRELGSEVTRPVSFRDARWFRWITVGFVAIVPTIAFIIACVQFDLIEHISEQFPINTNLMSLGISGTDAVLPWIQGLRLWPMLIPCVLLFFALVTGAPGYWFSPRVLPIVRQNRAVAISFYSCAPLFWTAGSALVFGVCVWMLWLLERGDISLSFTRYLDSIATKELLQIGAGAGEVGFAIAWFLCWMNTLRILARAVDASSARIFSAAIGIPLLWVFDAILCFGILPWLIGFAWLMIDSLR